MGGVFVLLDDCSRVLTKRYGVIADNEFDTGSGQAAEIYEPPPSSLENAINSAALCLTLTAFRPFFSHSPPANGQIDQENLAIGWQSSYLSFPSLPS